MGIEEKNLQVPFRENLKLLQGEKKTENKTIASYANTLLAKG
jgi:hypothetical protein